MKKSPSEAALMDIIEGMKKLRIEKVKGFKNRADKQPTLEIEEMEDDDEEDED